MNDFIFEIQRFAEDTFTDEKKITARENCLPHLRMISNIAKNPLVSGLVSTLENFKDGVGNISKDILPIYEFVASIYDIYQNKNLQWHH